MRTLLSRAQVVQAHVGRPLTPGGSCSHLSGLSVARLWGYSHYAHSLGLLWRASLRPEVNGTLQCSLDKIMSKSFLTHSYTYMWKACSYIYFNFLFEIIVGSHAVLRSNADRSHIYFTWSPPLLTSYKTIVKFQNQGWLALFRFHQFCLQFFMCVFSSMQMYHMCRFMSPPSQ